MVMLLQDKTYQAQTLRPYQAAAIPSINLEWNAGKKTLVAMATGGGKTTVGSQLIKETVNLSSQRVLVIGNTKEIVQQWYDRITNQFEGILQAHYTPNMNPGIGIVMGEQDTPNARIVVATYQSCHQRRLPKILKHGVIDVLVIDECDQAFQDNSFGKIIDTLKKANPALKVVGFTATPARGDKKALGSVFDSIAYEWLIPEGIQDGYLVPVQRLKVATKVNLGGVKTSQGDYQNNALVSALDASNWLDLCFDAYQQHIASTERPCLAFFPSVEMSKAFAARLQTAGILASHLDGETPKLERQGILRDYQSGKLRTISNCAVLCLDAQTEILTDTGWVGMDDMTYSHKVANWDNGHIFFEEPKFIIRRKRHPGERMVTLETVNRSIRVTEDHRMLFKKRGQKDFHIVYAKDLIGLPGYLPISGIAAPFIANPEQPAPISDSLKAKRITAAAYTYRKNGLEPAIAREKAAIAISERLSLRYKAPSELTIPECELIGFWIGDGSKNLPKKGGVVYTFSQSLSYPNIVRWFDSVLEETGFDFVKREKEYGIKHIRWSLPRGTGFSHQKRKGLFALEPYLDKQGSPLLWGLNGEQFDALLRGFWYADGDHGKADCMPDRYRYSNTNYQLLSLLQAIAVCRGYRANINIGHNHIKNPDHAMLYNLHVSKRTAHELTKFTLQFEDAPWQDEMVWCVTSTTGNIITRRRGTVTVTGNTRGYDAPATAAIFMARPTRSRTLFTQIVGRGLRPFPGKHDCLLVDMSVLDTKALEVGTLLGKMITCPECGIEHYAGLKQCPGCGYTRTWKQQVLDGGAYLGKKELEGDGLITNYDSLFEKAFAAWYHGADGFFSCTITFEDGAMIIVPPLEDNLYRLARVPKAKGEKVEYLSRNEDLAALMLDAEGHISKKGEDLLKSVGKDAAWRSDPASPAQLGLLASLGVKVDAGISKGSASQLLTHTISVKRLLAEG